MLQLLVGQTRVYTLALLCGALLSSSAFAQTSPEDINARRRGARRTPTTQSEDVIGPQACTSEQDKSAYWTGRKIGNDAVEAAWKAADRDCARADAVRAAVARVVNKLPPASQSSACRVQGVRDGVAGFLNLLGLMCK